MIIETARLRLVPFAPQVVLALVEGRQLEHFEWRFAPGLREMFQSPDVSPVWLDRLRAATVADPWEHGFAVVHRASDLVIGSAGFKGRPDAEGIVEIAYGIVPAYQRQGYATESAAALVDHAFRTAGVHAVRAHTLPAPSASTRVLAKCGFTRIGEVVDPEDGLVWRWQRLLMQTSTAI